MKDPGKIEGRWWIHGLDQPAWLGALDLGNQLRLKVQAANEIGIQHIFERMAKQDDSMNCPLVVQGRDEHDKPVSLFGCYCTSKGQSGGLERYEITALAGIRGLEVESWRQPFVRALSVQPDFFSLWLGKKIFEHVELPDGRPALTPAMPLDQVFPVEDGVRIRLTTSMTSSSGSSEESFRLDGHVVLHFDEPRSLEEISERWIPWITRLLGLLMGTSVKLPQIEVHETDSFESGHSLMNQKGELLGRGKSGRSLISKLHPMNMVTTCAEIHDRLGEIILSWNRLSNELAPVIDLFSAVVFHHALYLEARFLIFVQALEIFHSRSPHFTSTQLPRDQHQAYVSEALSSLPEQLRDWAKGKLSLNSKSLREKLEDIFRLYSVEAIRLFPKTDESASRIAYTRNHLTHHHSEPDEIKLLTDSEICDVTWALEAFLWTILLREIGLSGSPLERVMQRVTRGSTIKLGGAV
jgi:hypothetical protein